MASASKARAAQEFVPIKEIRDGVATLKDGSLRAVLMASSLNFALKSGDEQAGILYQFQNFLNSLDFPVQFHIESRELDIRPYIALLEERHVAQEADLLKVQTREYIEFIKTFTKEANVMTKNFFIVVPYTPALISKNEGIKGLFSNKKSVETETRTFEEARTQLYQRVGVVEQGLVRTGVRVVQLGTEELIELFYKTFNPGDLDKPIRLNT